MVKMGYLENELYYAARLRQMDFFRTGPAAQSGAARTADTPGNFASAVPIQII
jgi:hypothetical protein